MAANYRFRLRHGDRLAEYRDVGGANRARILRKREVDHAGRDVAHGQPTLVAAGGENAVSDAGGQHRGKGVAARRPPSLTAAAGTKARGSS